MSLPLGQAQVVRWGGTVPLAWPVLRLTSSHVVYAQPPFSSGKDCVHLLDLHSANFGFHWHHAAHHIADTD